MKFLSNRIFKSVHELLFHLSPNGINILEKKKQALHIQSASIWQTAEPSNYWLIACLSTGYNIQTSILTERIYHFLDRNKILSEEAKGCKEGSHDCKD